MTVSAHAFLVDNSQQKTIYIGKGNAQNMQAVTVQEIPPATTTIQQTRTYTNTNTAPNTYNQGYTNTQVTQSSVPAGTTTSQPFAIQPYGQQTNYGSSYQYGEQLPISTKSAAAIVFDLQTGQPIYQKNADAVRSIASVTKVMTAMVLMDAGLDMREEIVIEPSDFIAAKKASSNLRSGDRMSRSEFMLLMLMKSENPAAKALARTYPGGYDNFIWAMNQKAKSLGMNSTSYSDASGLDPRNRSSANDLVKMMRAVNSDPRYQTVRNFSTAPNYDFYVNNYNSGSRTYKAQNTSRLIRAGNHPIGVSKTGFIREAGYCYVMETHVNNRPAVVVLLGASASNSRWDDAEDILTQLAYRY
ncbi:serine hydrolase [Moraxella bovis]|uniref:Serine hydrolase n=2 Tax=Moraxella bovis TaxID=476 RepID=A0ABY6MAI7_MORBO|nr:serine hydrolase [Moraxella bovis]UYZ69689.1 serine hydrolase [Moraxella bovis]UYZ72070.1 serine hydrolase [Moraxella bovis]UYZ74362.1 serine hydrolase [Moraxella bovis]UZA04618.1 serine hydrolase [Moraxella bovis]UZA10210.1 serine hydrolase [Moraxella bovis]